MARVIEITTPLEKDVLLFHKMRGAEEMSRLFEFELELLSLDGEIDLDEVLGKAMTVTFERADDGVRHFSGMCSRISQGGKAGRYHVYYATVRPWLWFLTRTKNYRIFQEKSVPDILKEMFDQHSAIANVEFELTETYTPWTYCVQYNESDFAFVSRLMEHEGIYYFFRHAEGKHTLVVADSYSAHAPVYEQEVPFIPPHERVRPEKEHVSEWSITRELQPGKYALASYDFEKPSVDLQVRSNVKRSHALAEFEVFEYGGDYVERGDGELYARTRIEEVQAKYERTRGVTNARAFVPGGLFKLGSHPRADQNAEYLIVSAQYELQSAEYEARDREAAEYSCRFTALNTKHPFRAERLTPKPVVQGPQTAVVVGPPGEEIYTDKYGRVKVHFYWDRKSQRDDKSSCWIRVSQNWGGKNWGGMFIPHVGQEVIVQFEGGDPDLPLITGRVYNSEQMPPVELPAGKTQSIIRDHGGNEIKMEGNGGAQQIKMYSPTGNTTFAIGAPGSPGDGIEGVTDLYFKLTVGLDYKEKIDGQKISLVQGDKTTLIDGSKNERISGTESKRIFGKKTEVVVGAENKVNLVSKNEVIGALATKIQKGGKVEIDNAKMLLKSPDFKSIIGAVQVKYGEWKLKVAEEQKRVAGNLKTGAAMIQLTCDEMVFDSAGNGRWESDIMRQKASSLLQNADTIKEEGDNLISKGKKKITGKLTVNGTELKVG